MYMVCIEIEQIVQGAPQPIAGILELYSQVYNKTVGCYPQYLERVVEWWKTDAINTETLTNSILYLVDKGLIYIT